MRNSTSTSTSNASVRTVSICAHPEPPASPRVSRVQASGGRCSGTTPLWPCAPWEDVYLVALVAVHLKHATNRLPFICANPRLQGCMSIACFECLPLPPLLPFCPSARSLSACSRSGPAQPARAHQGAPQAHTHRQVRRRTAVVGSIQTATNEPRLTLEFLVGRKVELRAAQPAP